MFFTPFIFGVLGASLALVLEVVVLNIGSSVHYTTLLTNFSSFSTLISAALIEEVARYLLLRQYIFRFLTSPETSGKQVLLTGLFFGVGFASIELALILAMAEGSAPFLATLGIALVHMTLSVLFAFSLTKKLPFPALLVLLSGVTLHFLYNMALSQLF